MSCHLNTEQNSEDYSSFNHLDNVEIYYDLAVFFQKEGNSEESLNYWLRYKEIKAKLLHHNHPDLATIYFNLGVFCQNIEKYDESLDYYQKSLKIREEIYPSDNPDIASIYYNLGFLLNNICKYKKSLTSFLKCTRLEKSFFLRDILILVYYIIILHIFCKIHIRAKNHESTM